MYHRMGTYDGSVSLQEMADRIGRFDVAYAPTGYGTTTDHLIAIRDAFRPDLESVLPGVWAYSMLVVIRPEGLIRFHVDVPQAPNLERYHLVLQTNSRCWNYHDGDWQQLDLGGIYRVDPTKEHFSVNGGETHRIHLVVDLEAVRTGAASVAPVLATA